MENEKTGNDTPTAKKLILSVSDSSDFFEAADYAVIELTAEMIARIRKLSEAVRTLGVYRVSEFDYSCAFMNADYDQWESGKVPLKEYQVRTECNLLNVTDNGFYWSGLYRHTDIRWSTDTVYLSDLDSGDDYDEREEYPENEEQEAV